MLNKLISLFKKKKVNKDRVLPEAQVMQEAYKRITEAKEKVTKCNHLNRVAHRYDTDHDEVMCLDCGLIKILQANSTNNYTKKKDLPDILKNKPE